MAIFFDLATDMIPEGGSVPLDVFIRDHGFSPDLVMIRMDGDVVRKNDIPVRDVVQTSRIRVYKLVGGG